MAKNYNNKNVEKLKLFLAKIEKKTDNNTKFAEKQKGKNG
jgi:hypothetical protein